MRLFFSLLTILFLYNTNLSAQKVYEVNADSLNIRKTPSSKATRIGAVRKGELVDCNTPLLLDQKVVLLS